MIASTARQKERGWFLLFNARGVGGDPGSSWVLLVGVLWIVVMTYICYRGIEVSANFQKALVAIELVMLVVLSVTALVKVGNGTARRVAAYFYRKFRNPAFFRGQTLTRSTVTLVPDPGA